MANSDLLKTETFRDQVRKVAIFTLGKTSDDNPANILSDFLVFAKFLDLVVKLAARAFKPRGRFPRVNLLAMRTIFRTMKLLDPEVKMD